MLQLDEAVKEIPDIYYKITAMLELVNFSHLPRLGVERGAWIMSSRYFQSALPSPGERWGLGRARTYNGIVG